jgi:hypothetical protein
MNGLVPSLLVFGTLPRITSINTYLLAQREILEAMKLAQAEMNTTIAKQRIQEALTRRVPSAADVVLKIDQPVRVYREKAAAWLGPFHVHDVDRKNVTVSDEKQRLKTLSLHQVGPVVQYIDTQALL